MDLADDEREQLDHALRRRDTLRTILAAQQRHLEVGAVIAAAEDRTSAGAAVAALLAASDVDALGVVDMPWRNLCGQRREQAREDLAAIERLIERMTGTGGRSYDTR